MVKFWSYWKTDDLEPTPFYKGDGTALLFNRFTLVPSWALGFLIPMCNTYDELLRAIEIEKDEGRLDKDLKITKFRFYPHDKDMINVLSAAYSNGQINNKSNTIIIDHWIADK